MRDLTTSIPEHLVGEYYNMPDAPPFGKDEEKHLIKRTKAARTKVIKMLPKSVGQKIATKNGSETIKGVIIGPKKGEVTYVCPKDKVTANLPTKLLKDKQFMKVMADYENERHNFTIRYSFVVQKIASDLCNQCHRGMGYDDLCQVGFCGVMNAIDKWPPFLGAKNQGHRLLTSVRKAVHNALCRWLDDYNRDIKVPSYKIDQITVRMRSDDIFLGKVSKNGKRKSPGQFELAIQKMAKELDLEPGDIDGKSLKELAIETSRYRLIAEAANLDIASFLSILLGTASIDTPISSDNEESIADMIPHEEYDSEGEAFKRESLEEALDHIPARNAQIIREYYFGGLSIRELAEKHGFSTMRASDLIKKSVNKIKGSKAAMNVLIHKVVGKP